MWNIVIQMKGDEPTDESEIDDITDKIVEALDKNDIEYMDVTVR